MYQHGGDIYTYKNVLDFSTNINFRGMPDAVKEAAEAAISYCSNYPDPQYRQLRQAISQREQVPEEWIICGNGAAELIFTLVLAAKPKKALVPAPSFYEYQQALRSVDARVEKYKLQEKDGFRLQEDVLEKVDADTDLVFLCNPNNPTGILTEPELLESLLERCQRCDAILVVDECFNDFLDRPEYYSMKSSLARSEHLVILKAFTKMYAMAGLRLGYILCHNAALIGKMEYMRQPWSVSIPAQMAGTVAAKDVQFARESRDIISVEREKLKQNLINEGFPTLDGAANYLLFQGTRELEERCLSQGILIRDCSNFEGLTAGWYRVAVRSAEDNQHLLKVLQGNL